MEFMYLGSPEARNVVLLFFGLCCEHIAVRQYGKKRHCKTNASCS